MAKKKVELENVAEVTETNVQAEEVVKELPEITFEDFKEKVTVKEHLSYTDKQAIVQIVYNNTVIYDSDNGIYFIDNIMSKMSYNLTILDMCTDFYDVIENADLYDYDYLNQLGVFEYISLKIDDNDYQEIHTAIRNFKDRVEGLNSVGSCLHRIVNESFAKLPDMKDMNKLINNLPKAINKIDKDVIGIFAKELGNGNVLGKKKN